MNSAVWAHPKTCLCHTFPVCEAILAADVESVQSLQILWEEPDLGPWQLGARTTILAPAAARLGWLMAPLVAGVGLVQPSASEPR